MPKKNPDIIQNHFFAKSVDRPLRKLVKWLHMHGIKTTPSCSGHHISQSKIKTIYAVLEADKKDICTDGLDLKDIESSKIYCFKNENYQLPWSKNKFAKKVRQHQKKGVLGIRLGNHKKAKEQLMMLQIPGVTFSERDGVFFIFTTETPECKIHDMWAKVTEEVILILS